MPSSDVTLSVVVPVRNGMPYIREALASVLTDDNPDLEVIVRENFSTDGTAEWLAEQSDPRLRVVVAAHPSSAAENWTEACKAASGTWVKLLCADDFVTQGGVARQLAAAVANPGTVMVASRRKIVSETSAVVLARHGLLGYVGRRSGKDALRKAVLSGANPFGEPSSVLMRRDALQASLPFGDQYPYLTDLDMYIRVLEHGDFVGLGSIDGAFRVSSTSWSASIGAGQLQEHLDWVESVERAGKVRLTGFARIALEVRLRVRYLARKAFTTAMGIAQRS